MAWPTPQEYNEAVQNPAQSFADPELAGGVPQVTALGLPRPITGNFASVYRLRCGRSDWAVRCFFREYADMRERYAAISRHLAARPLPYTVGFQYLEQGIMVRGSWYPILKMEWVEGELLGDFVERHLSDGRLLARLAERWLVMLRELEGACIAHGDLQHGNVMVVAGELRLVDYDGMFVPALDGRTSHEIGHPNYQHPSRSGSDFGAHLDRFSAWVIYLSLQALSRDPSLWQRTGAGDECLLFRRADFERPQASAIVPLLTHHGDAEIRALAGRFVAALSARLDRIERVAPPAAPVRGQRGAGGRYGLKWRLTQALAPSVSPGATSRTEAPETSAIPEWLRDALPAEPERSHFAARSSLPLLPLIASTVVLALAAAPVLLQYLSVAATVASLLTAALSVGTASCLVAYRRQPSVRALRAVRRREVAQRGRIGRLERRIARRLGREVGERNRLERAVKRAADR
ncbi:MAG TPA: hypothetical protein VKX16_16560, partial [Chloroflexota bacterium]|nr:hypothetical protein [Chloroflexota bacterium]